MQSWFEPVPIHPLVFFRIILGALISLIVLKKYFGMGLLQEYYVKPTFHFTYYGFSWVKPLSETGMYLVFWVMLLAGIGMVLGLFYRLSAICLFLTWTYVFLIDKAFYQNHHYLVCLITFWMIFLPANGLFSLDGILFKKQRQETMPAWMLWALRLFIAIPYLYGAFAKMNLDWLQAKQTWIWVQYGSIGKSIPDSLKFEFVGWFIAYFGLLFDLLVVPALFWGRTRLPACLAVFAFHFSNSIIFRIGLFPWMMMFSTLLFFPPDLIPQVIAAIKKKQKFDWSILWRTEITIRPNDPPAVSLPFNRSQRIVIVSLVLFFGFQLLFPFRHWLYPGNPSWNGKGDLFAWRMMLDDKLGFVDLRIVDRKNKQVKMVSTRDPKFPIMLTEHQKMNFPRLPDFVLQYAHFLEKEMIAAKNGELSPEDVEIYARVMIALNGRPFMPLLNPDLDLTTVPRTLFEHERLILPQMPTPPGAESPYSVLEKNKKAEGGSP